MTGGTAGERTHDSGELPAEGAVKSLGRIAFAGVQHECGAPEAAGLFLDGKHESAAYAAAAGIEAHIFMPADVPQSNFIECKALGARVTLVDGLISDCGRIVAELPPETSDDVIGRAMLGMEDA